MRTGSDSRTRAVYAAGAMFVLAVLGIQITIALTGISPVLDGEMADTDSYMRLLRVERMFEGGGWLDGGEPRADAPFGESSHWTRPLDVILAALALPLIPVLGVRSAVFLAGVIVPPLLTLGVFLGTAWAAWPLVGRAVGLLIPVAILAQPIVAEYSLAGRVDHHPLILALFVFALGHLVRALCKDTPTTHATRSGILAGLGLWVSTEFLAPLALLLGGMAYAWIVRGRGRARTAIRFSVAFAATVGASVILERGPRGVAAIEFDRISLPHVLMAGLALAFWVTVARRSERIASWQGRATLAAVVGPVVLGLMALVFPDFFRGPLVHVDPAMNELWLPYVTELHSLLPGQDGRIGAILFHVGPALVAIPWLAWRTARARGTSAHPSWALLTGAVVAFTALALLQRRWSTYAEVLGAVGLVGAILPVLDSLGAVRPVAARVVVRASIVGAALIGFPIVGGLMVASQRPPVPTAIAADPPCLLRKALGFLDTPSEPRTVLALMDFGPEILYRTNHRVVATPYHRNSGVVESHRMLSDMDAANARQALARREIDLILLCPARDRGFFERVGGPPVEGSLYPLLTSGESPDWLEALPLPHETGFLAFRTTE